MPIPTNKKLIITVLVFAIFLPRLLSLGTVLTVDEPLWASRGATFMNGFASGQFDRTLVAGQPGVTTSWLVGLTTPSDSIALKQASIAITTGLLILLCTYFFVQLFGFTWGIIMGFFLGLDPFLIGHSRVIHTDALQALFYLSSISAILAALAPWSTGQRQITRYIVLSGIVAACAILSKIFTIFVIPTVLIIILGLAIKNRIGMNRIVHILGTWVSSLILAFFLLWPALWFNADTVFDYITGRATLHSEGTRAEETTSLPWYYEREFVFRLATPIAILIPFGLWYAFKNRRLSSDATIILISGLAFAAALSFTADKSDRYILFTLLSCIPIAALGLRHIWEVVCSRTTWGTALSPFLLLLPIVVLAADDIRLHPYYLATYNRLYPIEDTHKLGWGEGLEKAVQWIHEQKPDAKVVSYYPRVFSYFAGREASPATHVGNASEDYIVLYRSMLERGEDSAESDILREYLYSGQHTPVHVININGLPYVWIFAGQTK